MCLFGHFLIGLTWSDFAIFSQFWDKALFAISWKFLCGLILPFSDVHIRACFTFFSNVLVWAYFTFANWSGVGLILSYSTGSVQADSMFFFLTGLVWAYFAFLTGQVWAVFSFLWKLCGGAHFAIFDRSDMGWICLYLTVLGWGSFCHLSTFPIWTWFAFSSQVWFGAHFAIFQQFQYWLILPFFSDSSAVGLILLLFNRSCEKCFAFFWQVCHGAHFDVFLSGLLWAGFDFLTGSGWGLFCPFSIGRAGLIFTFTAGLGLVSFGWYSTGPVLADTCISFVWQVWFGAHFALFQHIHYGLILPFTDLLIYDWASLAVF